MTDHPSFLDPEVDESDDETGYTWDNDREYPKGNHMHTTAEQRTAGLINFDTIARVIAQRKANRSWRYVAVLDSGAHLTIRESSLNLYCWAHVFAGSVNTGKPAGLPSQTTFSENRTAPNRRRELLAVRTFAVVVASLPTPTPAPVPAIAAAPAKRTSKAKPIGNVKRTRAAFKAHVTRLELAALHAETREAAEALLAKAAAIEARVPDRDRGRGMALKAFQSGRTEG